MKAGRSLRATRRPARRAPLQAVLAPLVLAAALACGSGDAAPEGEGGGPGGGPRPPVVEVLRVAPQTLAREADLLGQLEPAERVVVRSEVPGLIASIDFQEGEPVEDGEVLFRLRDGEQVARLHEARADLAVARDAHERALELSARDILPEAQVERLASELEAAKARVEIAQVELDRTRIRAPFDGVAGARQVSPGSRVQPEDPLVTVEAIHELELVFTLPEAVLPLARTGVPIELSVAPYPGRSFPGEISFVAPSVNPENRRLLVKARVPNEELLLRPGLFAKVHADLGQREGALMIPADAVVYGTAGSFVWRVGEGSVVEPVDVELGAREAGRVEVLAGLEPGELVVTAGTHKLQPGVRVEVVSAPDEPAAPTPFATDGGGGALPEPGAG